MKFGTFLLFSIMLGMIGLIVCDFALIIIIGSIDGLLANMSDTVATGLVGILALVFTSLGTFIPVLLLTPGARSKGDVQLNKSQALGLFLILVPCIYLITCFVCKILVEVYYPVVITIPDTLTQWANLWYYPAFYSNSIQSIQPIWLTQTILLLLLLNFSVFYLNKRGQAS